MDISSLLLFSVDISGRHIIKYFSHRHKLHLLLTFEYDRACFTLRHLMLCIIFLSFRLQICLLNSVACLYRSLLNEHTWFLYLNLKVVSKSNVCLSLCTELFFFFLSFNVGLCPLCSIPGECYLCMSLSASALQRVIIIHLAFL